MIRTAIVFIKDCLPKAKKGDIPFIYSGTPTPDDYSLEWKDPTYTAHLIIPQILDPRAIKASFNPDGSFKELIPDPAKLVVIKMTAKSTQVSEAYQRMDKEIFDRMQIIFGTRRSDSSAAFMQTWQLMTEKPELFAGQPGVIADSPVAGLLTGQPLSTVGQVTAFAAARMNMANAFAVWRMQRITQFMGERSTIMAAP